MSELSLVFPMHRITFMLQTDVSSRRVGLVNPHPTPTHCLRSLLPFLFLLQKVDYWKYFFSQVLNEHLWFLRKGFYIRLLSIRNVAPFYCLSRYSYPYFYCKPAELNLWQWFTQWMKFRRLGLLFSEVSSLFLRRSRWCWDNRPT